MRTMDQGPSQALAERVLSTTVSPALIEEGLRGIHEETLARSQYVADANFKTIHPRDLEFLFGAYDERFFQGLCSRALNGRRLSFRLSTRMIQAGGKTTRIVVRNGDVRFEIAIAIGILFDGFDSMDRNVTVCGLECTNRLDALQRIFEHEMLHLIELLCWNDSNCCAARFQDIATRFFLHRTHTHNLVTRRERAAHAGVRAGSLVTFLFEGQKLTGRVNRITKRATVLVEHPDGALYSDGRRYKTFYVPLTALNATTAPLS